MSLTQQTKLTEEEKALKAKQKEERRLAFEAKKAAEMKNKLIEPETNKSKSDLKKERREKQEAQRAAKSEKQNKVVIDTVDFSINLNSNSLLEDHQLIENLKQESVQSNEIKRLKLNEIKSISNDKPISRSTKSSPTISTTSSNKLNKRSQIFAHIPKRETDLIELTNGLGYNGEQIHSSVIKIGLKMNQNLISDPTNRCIAFLVAFKSVIKDYEENSPKKLISRDLEQKLDKYVLFLDRCRPLNVSMRNVIRIIRSYITKLSSELNIKDAKSYLINLIDKFIHEEIKCGLEGIREHGNLKINQNDVILTFGNSFLIKHIFKEAKQAGKQFRVVVVDSLPRLDGKKLAEFLNELNIDTTYVLISALSYVMKEVNKVLIEAHTLLANGYMISEMGASQIALVAKSHNVPVLICCETYKFSERVHTDSFVFNEADSAKDFLNSHPNSNLCKLFENEDNHDKNSQLSNLSILNLYYDVTPRDFISLVITEMGFLPSTAVPAIVRRNISKFQLDG